MASQKNTRRYIPLVVLALLAFLGASAFAMRAAGDPSGPSKARIQAASSRASAGPQATTSASVKKQIKGLKRRIAALEAKPDQVGQTPSSLPPSGAAAGALAGSYPNPTLNVSGGPCANGQALTNVSSLAALTCKPGVYSDTNDNVAAGPTSFPALTGGFGANSALGSGVLAANDTGSNNSAVGFNALTANTSGSQNSALGRGALAANDTGSFNSAVGFSALEANTTGSDNSALGQGALSANPGGNSNAAVGSAAMGQSTSGNDNSALGQAALGKNTGDQNSAVGTRALFNNNTGGTRNSAVGYEALFQNTANDNSAFGHRALTHNTTGTFNAAFGQNALTANSTGAGNVAFGASTLLANTGSLNTAIGAAGPGVAAGQNLTTGSNNIDIGSPGLAGESGTIRIGANINQSKAFMGGIFGATTGDIPSTTPVMIDNNGQLGTIASSRRYKQDIHALGSASDPLMRLRPVSFRYRSDPSQLQYGLIAEQVARVMPTLAVYGRDGVPETVKYQDLPVLLLNEVQEQRRQNDSLRAENRRQQEQIDWLMRQVRGR